MRVLLLISLLTLFFLTPINGSAYFDPVPSTTDAEVPFLVDIGCSNNSIINYLMIRNPDNSLNRLFKFGNMKEYQISIHQPGIYTARCIHLYPPSHFGKNIIISPKKTINARLPTRNIDIPLSGQGTLKLTIRDENTVPFNYEDNVRFSIENTFHQNVRYNPIGGYQVLLLGTTVQNRITIIKGGYPVTTRDFLINPETLIAELDLRLYRTNTPEGGTLIVNVFASDGNVPLPTARVSVKYGDDWIAKDIQPGTPIPNLIIPRTYTIIVEADGMRQRITPVLIGGREKVQNVHLLSEDFQL